MSTNSPGNASSDAKKLRKVNTYNGRTSPLEVPKGVIYTDCGTWTKFSEQQLTEKKTIVVLKIGSSSISSADGGHLNLSTISNFAEMACDLVRKNYHVIIVTSGAVSVGCQRLGLKERPNRVVQKQAVAAVGQGRLMRLYDDLFSIMGQPIAQILLSREHLAREHHYRNSMNTFRELMDMGIIPIVNENDTAAVDELRFGDNDTLSALIASLIHADWLFLLTDVDALYTSNPRHDPDARAVRVVEDISALHVDTGKESTVEGAPSTSGKWGTGGMSTKIQAATIATSAGVRTAICSTSHLNHVDMLLNGSTEVGTQFVPVAKAIKGRKKWIAHGIPPAGSIIVDHGCAKSVLNKNSVFAAGIVGTESVFPSHSAVRIMSIDGIELGRGLTNYSSADIELIKGLPSKLYESILGFNGPDAVVPRGNLVVLPSALTPVSSLNNLNLLAGDALESIDETKGEITDEDDDSNDGDSVGSNAKSSID